MFQTNDGDINDEVTCSTHEALQVLENQELFIVKLCWCRSFKANLYEIMLLPGYRKVLCRRTEIIEENCSTHITNQKYQKLIIYVMPDISINNKCTRLVGSSSSKRRIQQSRHRNTAWQIKYAQNQLQNGLNNIQTYQVWPSFNQSTCSIQFNQ